MNPDQTPTHEGSEQLPNQHVEPSHAAAPARDIWADINRPQTPEAGSISDPFAASTPTVSASTADEVTPSAENTPSTMPEAPVSNDTSPLGAETFSSYDSSPLSTEPSVSPGTPVDSPVASAVQPSEAVAPQPPAVATSSPAVEDHAPAEVSVGVPVSAPGAKPKRGKHGILLAAGVALLLVALGSAYVFAYYIPNRPDNVWKSALVNSGKAYDTMTNYATTAAKGVKGVDMQGSYKVKGSVVSDGTFTGKSLGSNAEFSGAISASGLKINYDVRSLKSTGDAPDIYFKLSGVQGLGDLFGSGNPTLGTALNGLNNQWYSIDHTLIEQLGSSNSGSGTTTTPVYSANDYDSLIKSIGDPSKTYLFTDNTDKAVFVQKSYVGAEKRDGRSVYHYKAGVDKAHLKTYLQALCTGLQNNTIGKQLLDNGVVTTKCTDFSKKADSVDSTQTADVWVDRGTKLVHAVRFTEKGQSANYVEITQNYQSGNEYPFGVKVHDKTNDAVTTASLNGSLNSLTNTLTVNGTLEYTGTSSSTGSFDFTIKPNTDATFKVTAPENAKNILQLMSDLGVGQSLGARTTSVGTSSSVLAVPATSV